MSQLRNATSPDEKPTSAVGILAAGPPARPRPDRSTLRAPRTTRGARLPSHANAVHVATLVKPVFAAAANDGTRSSNGNPTRDAARVATDANAAVRSALRGRGRTNPTAVAKTGVVVTEVDNAAIQDIDVLPTNEGKADHDNAPQRERDRLL